MLFQATNGSPVMRFSNASHVCILNSISADDGVKNDNSERAFAVLRLIETDRRSSSHLNDECHDMFTDISMDASAAIPPCISVTALVVMHDLAVPVQSAAAAFPVPSPALPVPKVLPSSAHKYVFSYNSRLRRGQEVSIFTTA